MPLPFLPILAFSPFILFFMFNLVTGSLLAYPLALAFSAPMDEVMTKSIQLSAVITFYPFVRLLQLNNYPALGLVLPKDGMINNIARGFVIGIVIMLAIVLTLYFLDVRTLKSGSPELFTIIRIALAGLIGGLLIGLIEEIFFRGAQVTAITRSGGGIMMAAALTSLFFAALHFIDMHEVKLDQTHWLSGFELLSGSLHKFSSSEIWGAFLALTAAGVFLTLIRLHEGHIFTCIGIHAGWVFIIKLTKHLTEPNEQHEWRFIAGYYDGITGYLAFFVIGLICCIYYFKFIKQAKLA